MVTYGCAVNLQHVTTGFRLASDYFKWNMKDESHIVTAMKLDDGFDERLLWYVKPDTSHKDRHNEMQSTDSQPNQQTPKGLAGSPVLCGDIVQFQHMSTSKHLYNNLSHGRLNYDAYSAVGYTPQGGDTVSRAQLFQVICSPKSKYWIFGQSVSLKNQASDSYLFSAPSFKYTSSNCPRCPIIGHLEMSLSKRGLPPKQTNLWRAEESLTLERYDDVEGDAKGGIKDEL